MNATIRINHNNEDLWCDYCKERINLGDKYAIVYEEVYGDELVDHINHLDCIPDCDEEEYFEED
jgi:hypothetical protein